MKKILHISLKGVSNVGDEAITDCLECLLTQHCVYYEHVSLNYYSPPSPPNYATKQNRKTIKGRLREGLRRYALFRSVYQLLIPLSQIGYYLNVRSLIKRSDIVLIGGGNILMTLDHLFPVHIYILTTLAKMLGKKVGFIAVGVGPITNKLGAFFVKKALKNSDFIVTRDAISTAISDDLINAKKAVTAFDPAFLADSFYPAVAAELRVKRILVSVFPYQSASVGYTENKKSQRQYQDFILKYIAAIKETLPDYEVGLLVTDRSRDIDLANTIAGKEEALSIFVPVKTSELVAIVRSSAFILSTRMHPAIIAASVGTPFVILSWQHKIIGCMSAVGLDSQVEDLGRLLNSPNGVSLLREKTVEYVKSQLRSQELRVSPGGFIDKISEVIRF